MFEKNIVFTYTQDGESEFSIMLWKNVFMYDVVLS